MAFGNDPKPVDVETGGLQGADESSGSQFPLEIFLDYNWVGLCRGHVASGRAWWVTAVETNAEVVSQSRYQEVVEIRIRMTC